LLGRQEGHVGLAYLGRVGHPPACRRRAAQPLGSGAP
jgi:hypothetical protein